jgi:peptide/nickel transport system substrate-binding protein
MSRTLISRSLLVLTLFSALAPAETGPQLRFCLRSDPKTFNPLLAEEEASETIRYLTGGVLMRLNRLTQDLEPELATSWKVSDGGRTISFKLRTGLAFSDGTPFSADDVAYTVQQMMDPSLHSPSGDAFRSGDGKVETKVLAPDRIRVTFPAPIAGLDKLFDQVAMLSARSPKKEIAVLGPFDLYEYKAGNYVLLERNPHYWRHDAAGKQLPYIQTVRLDIQSNRDTEMLRLVRGEIDFINSLDAEYYDKLMQQNPALVHDAGVSLDSEQMWFNQVPTSPLPEYKKAWFRSTNFRRAISESINRADLARVVYRGHARPAVGPMSPANKFWFNAKLEPHPFDQKSAFARLAQDGFRLQDGTLKDREGRPVEFSLITNAGNKSRERMATMIQQDLSGIGIKLNLVTLDFPSLIERITRSFDYDACLLGLINNDLDPNSSQMNVWLSSGENHQWNPGQKTPATPWEAEIDQLMREQASALDPRKRKAAFDRVQEIAWEQEPFIYLVNRNALSAVSPNAHNVHPVVLRPQVYWNIDEISIGNEVARNR